MTEAPPLKILITAIEPSADAIGARLMAEIVSQHKGPVSFTGCGGVEMTASGLYSPFPIDRLSVIGVSDIARVYRTARSSVTLIGELARRVAPDIVICIDGWMFSKAVARAIKKTSPDSVLVKYAAPQIWASRPGRVHEVRKYFDLVLSLFPFDLPFFDAINMPATFTGNPNFEAAVRAPKDNEEAFRETHGLAGKKIVALLPGSRPREISTLGPIFGDVATRLAARIPDIAFAIPVAAGMTRAVSEVTRRWEVPGTIVPASERFSLFAAAEVAVAASGTASTELAICGTPMVVAYKTSLLSYYVSRAIITVDFVSIMNIAAREEIIPEFIQHSCTADAIYGGIMPLLTEEGARTHQRQAFEKLLPTLGAGPEEHDIMPSAALSARRILEFYRQR